MRTFWSCENIEIDDPVELSAKETEEIVEKVLKQYPEAREPYQKTLTHGDTAYEYFRDTFSDVAMVLLEEYSKRQVLKTNFLSKDEIIIVHNTLIKENY
ncbi:MAG: hypothetical protein HQK91_14835 [Nitrospirae bacterium]|nr:hypothetical protein [Nitrospirota bacterium]